MHVHNTFPVPLLLIYHNKSNGVVQEALEVSPEVVMHRINACAVLLSQKKSNI